MAPTAGHPWGVHTFAGSRAHTAAPAGGDTGPGVCHNRDFGKFVHLQLALIMVNILSSDVTVDIVLSSYIHCIYRQYMSL